MIYSEAPQHRGSFRKTAIRIAPPWLSGVGTPEDPLWGGRLMYALGIQFDALAEYTRMGVIQRFPSVCQSEALPFIGSDRGLRRGGAEPESGYRERLRNAIPSWKKAGSAQAILEQLAAYFAPTPPVLRYVVNGLDELGNRIADWWTLENGVYSYTRANLSNWDWDGTYPPGRFWIIVYGQVLTPWYWGDGHVWGGGQSWGFEEDGSLITDVRSLIATWKAAGSHAGTFDAGLDAGILFTNDGSLFDPTAAPGSPGMPDGTWADPLNRDPNAFYLSGV